MKIGDLVTTTSSIRDDELDLNNAGIIIETKNWDSGTSYHIIWARGSEFMYNYYPHDWLRVLNEL